MATIFAHHKRLLSVACIDIKDYGMKVEGQQLNVKCTDIKRGLGLKQIGGLSVTHPIPVNKKNKKNNN